MTFKFIFLYAPPNSTMYINHIFSVLISLIYFSTVGIHNWFTLVKQITFPVGFISGGKPSALLQNVVSSHMQQAEHWKAVFPVSDPFPSSWAHSAVPVTCWIIFGLSQYLVCRIRNTMGSKICTLISNKQRHMGPTHCDLIHPSEHLLHVSVISPYWILLGL